MSLKKWKDKFVSEFMSNPYVFVILFLAVFVIPVAFIFKMEIVFFVSGFLMVIVSVVEYMEDKAYVSIFK